MMFICFAIVRYNSNHPHLDRGGLPLSEEKRNKEEGNSHSILSMVAEETSNKEELLETQITRK